MTLLDVPMGCMLMNGGDCTSEKKEDTYTRSLFNSETLKTRECPGVSLSDLVEFRVFFHIYHPGHEG